MALTIDNPDLAADGAACWVVKDEIVRVEFALDAGVLESAVGLNRYAAGDALLTGSTGDRWCVSRDRFDAKYRPETPTLPGQAGDYRNRPTALLAKRMEVPFSVARSAGGDVLLGEAGDWLLQYAPGDHGVVAQARFARVYRVLDGPPGVIAGGPTP
ncbi:MAG: PGDYG domain-containing protein [Steroidobacteraceae bacterium]